MGTISSCSDEEHGTDMWCPVNGDNGHFPDTRQVTMIYEHGEVFLDVPCRFCGRTGCAGSITILSDIDW